MRSAFGAPLRSILAHAIVITAGALALNACGDSNSSDGPYGLAGSISGLTADGLVLTDGSATTALSAGATSFVSATAFESGQSYAVTVKTQPAGLSCSVANGAGTFATSSVNNIAVT